ncbi:MAG: glycosyltransferase family 2 protein, partial [Chloroflexia bacterium]|nr:glycosyltransferase family 2 protein [Chloroflexia bacterium]
RHGFEIIFVDDGSRDKTKEVLTEMAVDDKRLKVISLSRNFGHQSALTAGFKYAKGDAIISMDCDLQDPPEVIEQMIEKWKEGYDIVYARRINYRKDSYVKKFASKFYYKILTRVADIEIPQNVGDFRLISKVVLDEINQMDEKSRYLRGMVAWTGFKSDFVDYYRPDREHGESGYSFRKLITLGMNGFLDFSFFPLRVGFVLGVISIITGTGLMIYQLLDFIINGAYYHLYKWLSVATFIFMGFLFMLIWIIGEYIGKIYNEVRSRPIYIVKEKINTEE